MLGQSSHYKPLGSIAFQPLLLSHAPQLGTWVRALAQWAIAYMQPLMALGKFNSCVHVVYVT